jgi:recombination protein RecR
MSSQKEKIVELFTKFPGIGPKQAQRFAYFLMKQNKGFIDNFSMSLQNLKNNSRQCIECYAWFSLDQVKDTNLCHICSSESRDKTQVIIVEKELDIDAIEKTSEYAGVYFVMGGKLPFLASDPREHIRIRELVEHMTDKLKAESKVKEIIFALPVTDEGDYEMDYIKKTIMQIVGMSEVKMSKLARGVSTGLEMEYIDHDTFKNAFSARE